MTLDASYVNSFLLGRADDSNVGGMEPNARRQLLDRARELGAVEDACAEMNMTMAQFRDACDRDKDLLGDIEIALGQFRANVRRRILDLALNGVERPIIGGQFKDQIITYETIPDGVAMSLLAKLHFGRQMATYSRTKLDARTQQMEGQTKAIEASPDFSRLSRLERAKLEKLMKKSLNIQDPLEGEAKDITVTRQKEVDDDEGDF